MKQVLRAMSGHINASENTDQPNVEAWITTAGNMRIRFEDGVVYSVHLKQQSKSPARTDRERERDAYTADLKRQSRERARRNWGT